MTADYLPRRNAMPATTGLPRPERQPPVPPDTGIYICADGVGWFSAECCESNMVEEEMREIPVSDGTINIAANPLAEENRDEMVGTKKSKSAANRTGRSGRLPASY